MKSRTRTDDRPRDAKRAATGHKSKSATLDRRAKRAAKRAQQGR